MREKNCSKKLVLTFQFDAKYLSACSLGGLPQPILPQLEHVPT